MKNFIFVSLVALLFTACGLPSTIYTDDEIAKYGFNVDENNSVMMNPPADKARIYFVREKAFAGSGISYFVIYQYNPQIKDRVTKADLPKSKESIVGTLSNYSLFVENFEAGKPISFALVVKPNFWSWAAAPVGQDYGGNLISYYIFTPQAGKIYCFAPYTGVFAGKNEHFFDQQKCETFIKKKWKK